MNEIMKLAVEIADIYERIRYADSDERRSLREYLSHLLERKAALEAQLNN